MRSWLELTKPAASRRVHLLLAGVVWSTVGSVLLIVGVMWIARGEASHVAMLVALAVLAGMAKAHWILSRTANRIVKRILERGDGKCLGGFISVRTWLAVAVMVVAGRIMRAVLPAPVAGFLYTGVGTALSLGARHYWVAWREERVRIEEKEEEEE